MLCRRRKPDILKYHHCKKFLKGNFAFYLWDSLLLSRYILVSTLWSLLPLENLSNFTQERIVTGGLVPVWGHAQSPYSLWGSWDLGSSGDSSPATMAGPACHSNHWQGWSSLSPSEQSQCQSNSCTGGGSQVEEEQTAVPSALPSISGACLPVL